MPKTDFIKQIEPIAKPVIIGVVAYFGIIRPLMKGFGFHDEVLENEVKSHSKAKAWNPNWFKKVIKNKIPNILGDEEPEKTMIRFKGRARLIREGFGLRYTDDDEIQIESAFRGLETQIEVSLLCAIYQSLYKVNLYTELRERLSPSEALLIMDYVASLPKYYPSK